MENAKGLSNSLSGSGSILLNNKYCDQAYDEAYDEDCEGVKVIWE